MLVRMQTKKLNQGETIFKEGDDSQESYRVLSGRVEISMSTSTGKRVLSLLAEGDIFGEMGMVDDKPRSASATALDAVELQVITEEDFNKLIVEDPAQIRPYLGVFFERLRSADNRLRLELQRRNPQKEGERTGSLALAEASYVDHDEQPQEADGERPGTVKMISVAGESPEASHSVDVAIEKFPFKIGRRYFGPDSSIFSQNDLFLADKGPYNVSRNHCAVELNGNRLMIRDRGSRLGTLVNGVRIGLTGESLTAELQSGENVVVLGNANGPFHFKVVIG